MPTRTINIALTEQTPQARTLLFIPQLTPLTASLLLNTFYSVTTAANGTGSIDLPTLASGTIRYDYRFPRDGGGYSTGYFLLDAGSAVDLETIITTNGAATDTVQAYVDAAIAAATATLATDSAVVHKTGNESVVGIKTFASSPIVPTPTTDYQPATKKYVDDNSTSTAAQALHFDHTQGQHVNHGYFWPRNGTFGHFFWEAWVNADTGAEYFISDGYGGAHTILFGLSGAAPCTPAGNIWNGSGTESFGANDSFAAGEWHHVAVGWNGTNIITYVDGVPSALHAFAGVRSSGNSASDGICYIGGSTHSNYSGYLRNVRGFEGIMPLNSPYNVFRPDANFRGAYSTPGGDTVIAAAFVADYTTPCNIIPDLSVGYGGATHPGILRNGNDTDTGGFGIADYESTQFPTWQTKSFTAPTYTGSITPTPVGAVVFDAFERDNVTYAWSNTLGLGTAPTGQTWTDPYSAPWGILGTYAFSPLNSSALKTVINVGKADQDVRMVRKNSTTLTSMLLRYTDANNYLYVEPDGAGGMAIVEYVAGVGTLLKSGGSFGTSWTELKGVVSGTTITVYVDGVATHAPATTSITTGNLAGMASQVPYYRVKSFTVY